MAQQKPEFRTYARQKLRHFFRNQDKLIFEDADGTRYMDDGSEHTVLIIAMLWLMFFTTSIVLEYTLLGRVLFLLLLVLHHFFRYFWTDFVVVDVQGEAVPDMACTTDRPRKKRAWVEKMKDVVGMDDLEEDTYRQKTHRRRVLFALEALAVLVAVVGVFLLANSREDAFAHWHSDDLVGIVAYVETSGAAYDTALSALDDAGINAQLYDYRIEAGDDTVFWLAFKNVRQGVLFHHPREVITIAFDSNRDYFRVEYDGAPDIWKTKATVIMPGDDAVDRVRDILETGDDTALIIEPMRTYDKDTDAAALAVTVGYGDDKAVYSVDIGNGTAVRME